MKNINLFRIPFILILGCVILLSACKKELSDAAVLAGYPQNGEVFLDVFSSGLEYLPFEFSYFATFSPDEETVQSGTASMRFDIPDPGNPDGGYAGAIFPDYGGRDLSEFDALTFWAKATKSVSINEIGFGIDFLEDAHRVTLTNLDVSTSWNQYMIAIPNPAKLEREYGLFWFSEAPEDNEGYTFWIDELQFLSTGAMSDPRPAIADGQNINMSTLAGVTVEITGLSQTFTLDTGEDQTTYIAPAYFDFESSEPSVAIVNDEGLIETVGPGTTIITASIAGVPADGSVSLSVEGEFNNSPEPTLDASQVVSIYSDSYTNEPVDYFNGFWAPYQTTQGGEIQISGQNMLEYTDLNFVGIQFLVDVPTIDASGMNHFYFDIQPLEDIESTDFMRIEINDAGPDNTLGTGDDSSGSLNLTASDFTNGEWTTINRPLSDFIGLSTTANLSQIIFVTDATIENVFIDNVLFHYDPDFVEPMDDLPTTGAPVPTQNAADVISIFSDTYTDQAGTNFNPAWGQSTSVSQETIAGNNTLVYSALNYQGIELAGSIDASGKQFVHLDYWTANSTLLNIYLISPGPMETPYSLPVPTSGWNSVDIPLSSFSSVVDLTDIFQLKFDGGGDIYLDNLYFY